MLLRLAMTLGLVYPLTLKYGLQGSCWAILIPAITIKFLVVPILIRIARFSLTEFLEQLLPAIACTTLIVVFLYLSRSFIAHAMQAGISPFIFFLLIILSILLYILVSSKVNSRVVKEMKAMLSALVKKSNAKVIPGRKE